MDGLESKILVQSVIDILEHNPIGKMAIDAPKMQKLLGAIQIPIESDRRQFPIEYPFVEKGDKTNTNLNFQYNSKILFDFNLCRVLANYDTGYKPGMIVKFGRQYREKQFEKNKAELKEENIEVVGRLARNDPIISWLLNSSLKKGFRHSIMGLFEYVAYSKKQDYEEKPKIPIIVIPGLLESKSSQKYLNATEEEKRLIDNRNKAFAEKIFEFGRQYQRPTREILQDSGYTPLF